MKKKLWSRRNRAYFGSIEYNLEIKICLKTWRVERDRNKQAINISGSDGALCIFCQYIGHGEKVRRDGFLKGTAIEMLLRMVGDIRVCWGKRDLEIIVTKNRQVAAMNLLQQVKGTEIKIKDIKNG